VQQYQIAFVARGRPTSHAAIPCPPPDGTNVEVWQLKGRHHRNGCGSASKVTATTVPDESRGTHEKKVQRSGSESASPVFMGGDSLSWQGVCVQNHWPWNWKKIVPCTAVRGREKETKETGSHLKVIRDGSRPRDKEGRGDVSQKQILIGQAVFVEKLRNTNHTIGYTISIIFPIATWVRYSSNWQHAAYRQRRAGERTQMQYGWARGRSTSRSSRAASSLSLSALPLSASLSFFLIAASWRTRARPGVRKKNGRCRRPKLRGKGWGGGGNPYSGSWIKNIRIGKAPTPQLDSSDQSRQRWARKNMLVCLAGGERSWSLHANHVVYLQLPTQ